MLALIQVKSVFRAIFFEICKFRGKILERFPKHNFPSFNGDTVIHKIISTTILTYNNPEHDIKRPGW